MSKKSIKTLEEEAIKLDRLSLKLRPVARKRRPMQSWRDRDQPPQKEVDKYVCLKNTSEANLLELVRSCLNLTDSLELDGLEGFKIDVDETSCDDCGCYIPTKFTVSRTIRVKNDNYDLEMKALRQRNEKYKKDLEDYISYTEQKLKEFDVDRENSERKEYERLRAKFGGKDE
jgi:hypothetical protein